MKNVGKLTLRWRVAAGPGRSGSWLGALRRMLRARRRLVGAATHRATWRSYVSPQDLKEFDSGCQPGAGGARRQERAAAWRQEPRRPRSTLAAGLSLRSVGVRGEMPDAMLTSAGVRAPLSRLRGAVERRQTAARIASTSCCRRAVSRKPSIGWRSPALRFSIRTRTAPTASRWRAFSSSRAAGGRSGPRRRLRGEPLDRFATWPSWGSARAGRSPWRASRSRIPAASPIFLCAWAREVVRKSPALAAPTWRADRRIHRINRISQDQQRVLPAWPAAHPRCNPNSRRL